MAGAQPLRRGARTIRHYAGMALAAESCRIRGGIVSAHHRPPLLQRAGPAAPGAGGHPQIGQASARPSRGYDRVADDDGGSAADRGAADASPSYLWHTIPERDSLESG